MKMEDGKIKYKCLPELVKSALILPHGNTDVERSLSVNTSVVTEDSLMAYASYRQRLDRDKEEKERQLKRQELAKAEKKRREREREMEDKRTTSLLDKEKERLKKESDIQGKLVSSEELLKDRSSKLNTAVEKGDLKGAGVAQMMINTATLKIEKLRREVDKVRESQ